MTFPYSDPRTDNQLFMDPCKAGKQSGEEKVSQILIRNPLTN